MKSIKRYRSNESACEYVGLIRDHNYLEGVRVSKGHQGGTIGHYETEFHCGNWEPLPWQPISEKIKAKLKLHGLSTGGCRRV